MADSKPNLSIAEKLELLKISGVRELFLTNSSRVSSAVPSNTKGLDKQELIRRLKEKYKDCHKCRLAETRTNFVYGEGNANTDIMFIGEAPGSQEDLQGKPFVGNAGQLLTKMLQAISLSREEVYITNVVKCRPPDNRNPFTDEIATCLPYLHDQIKIIAPRIICALGKIPAHSLLNTTDSLSRLRGRFFDYNGIKLIVTFHPAALLYHPAWKRLAWEDLKMIRRELNKDREKTE
jgi:DNA polymerase